MGRKILAGLAVCAAVALVIGAACFLRVSPAEAGPVTSARYQVLAPITHGNLTIFPVVSNTSHDTREFLTLDEGLRTGDVVVTEGGRVQPMIRRGRDYSQRQREGAEVNRLVLENNSKRPLLLLAGEIVTGGKQDRIVGKDRIVLPESDSDVNVFCVEPGRWTETSAKFSGLGAQMAQPSVRMQAMAKKDQQGVWDEVRKSQSAMETVEVNAQAPAPTRAEIAGTSSYAKVMDNKEVQKQVDAVAAPIQHSYEGIMRELRDRNAVGVVVAMNGRLIWADVFASTALLEKYWPKLVRSYAAEALQTSYEGSAVSQKTAQEFLEELDGKHEVVERDPGVFRHTEISGDGYRVFELTSLLPNTGFDVHVSKMAE